MTMPLLEKFGHHGLKRSSRHQRTISKDRLRLKGVYSETDEGEVSETKYDEPEVLMFASMLLD
jgi:hypothetical protein